MCYKNKKGELISSPFLMNIYTSIKVQDNASNVLFSRFS